MNVLPETAAGKYDYNGKTYYFCCPRCLERFRAAPAQFLTVGLIREAEAQQPAAFRNHRLDSPEGADRALISQGGALPPLRFAERPYSTGIFTCPMHPEVRQIGPGVCPICGMALEPEVVTLEEEANPE